MAISKDKQIDERLEELIEELVAEDWAKVARRLEIKELPDLNLYRECFRSGFICGAHAALAGEKLNAYFEE